MSEETALNSSQPAPAPTVEDLQRRLAETESALQATLRAQVDAVLDTAGQQSLLLKHAQEALRASETRYRRLMARMSAIIFELDPQGIVLNVNEAVQRLTGYAPEELTGRNWWDVFFPQDRRPAEALLSLLQNGDVSACELILTTRSGGACTLELNTANYYSETGQLERIVALGVDVSQRRQLEEERRQSEEKLQLVVDSAPVIIWAVGADDRVTLSEGAGLAPLGVKPGAWVDENVNVLTGNDPIIHGYLKRALAGEEILADVNFGPLILETRYMPQRNAQGEIIGVVGVSLDITERRKTEQRLRASDERYRRVIESVQDYAIFTLDPTGVITSWNKGAEKIKGYQADEIIGRHFSIFYTPEGLAAGIPKKALEMAARNGRFVMEDQRVRKDGTRFWANIVITALHDEAGQLIGFSKVVRDMTERREAEEALRRQTGFVKLQQEVAAAANEATSVEKAMQFALDAICAHSGWELGHVLQPAADETASLISMKIWHLGDRSRFDDFRRTSEARRFPRGAGFPGTVFATGESQWVSDVGDLPGFFRTDVAEKAGLHGAAAFPVLAGRQVVGVMEFYTSQVVAPDEPLLEVMAHIGTQLGRVVERARSEEQLRQSETRFRTIFEGAAIGIQLVDLDGHILASNPALIAMLGYQPGELGPAAAVHVDHPANIISNLPEFEALRRGRGDFFRLEKPYVRKDGHLIWGRLSVSLVRRSNGEPQFAIGMLEDVSERVQMEAELSELQRRLMEGREAERIHLAQELHDGPVQDLYGLSYHLKAFSSGLPPDQDREPLQEVQQALNQVVRTLRTICGDLRPPSLAPFGLEKAIRSHAETFQDQYPDLQIDLDLEADNQELPEPVRLALFRIYQQSLTNVVRHAQATRVTVRFNLTPEKAILSVEDDGRGFQMPRRWISLARQGHLGLVGAMERAEAIGGKLEVTSAPGQGTRLVVEVPRRPVVEHPQASFK